MDKPEVNQEVFILFNGELYTGKISEICDTPKANSEKIYFIFDIIIENQVYIPPSDLCIGGIREKFRVRACNKQFNPHPLLNINWTYHQTLTPAFIFETKELYEKHITNTKWLKRQYHLSQAKLYE